MWIDGPWFGSEFQWFGAKLWQRIIISVIILLLHIMARLSVCYATGQAFLLRDPKGVRVGSLTWHAARLRSACCAREGRANPNSVTLPAAGTMSAPRALVCITWKPGGGLQCDSTEVKTGCFTVLTQQKWKPGVSLYWLDRTAKTRVF